MDYDRQGRGWSDAEKLAIEGPHKFDEHYVKGIRAMKEAAKVWGDEDEYFLKAGVKFAMEFDEWEGFKQEDVEALKMEQGGGSGNGKRRGSWVVHENDNK